MKQDTRISDESGATTGVKYHDNGQQAIYTIAKTRGFPGHGGGHDEQLICRMGSYGSGEFPPFFPTADLAEAFRQSLDSWDRGDVVQCWLLTPNAS